jgi:hypothetical protein
MKRKDKILSKIEHLKRIRRIEKILDKEAKHELEELDEYATIRICTTNIK